MKRRPKASKKNRRNRRNRVAKFLERVHLDAAGIDIGSASHWVAVPEDRDDQPVREFKSFTPDLHALVDWLDVCGIDTVAMESTGVYWIPLFEILQERDFGSPCSSTHVTSKAYRVARAMSSIASGSSSCTPSGSCAAASDPMPRSPPSAHSCVTEAPSCRKPRPTSSACTSR